MKKTIILMFLFSIVLLAKGDRLNKIIENGIKNKIQLLSLQERMIPIAKEFINVPYLGGTLDIGVQEKCIINTDALDCVTFYENVLAIAHSFDNLESKRQMIEKIYNNVENTRYRDGKLDGYVSRLHYTSDWIIDNEKRGNIKNISKELKGELLNQNVYFMSKNYKKYPRLIANIELVKKIAKIEKSINNEKLFYIPKSKVESISSKIKSGDIIAITTNIKGLDFSHTGLAYRDKKGELRLFHASTKSNKVIIDEALHLYLKKHKTQTGICVLRPIN